MAKINIVITAQPTDFDTFANELGYLSEVYKSNAEIQALPQPVSIQDMLKPNPQSKTEFLTEYFKRVVVDELARVKIASIQKTIDVAKETEKENMRTAINSAVAVQYT